MVNIQFSSIISFVNTSDFPDGRILYELFRVCDNGRPISLGLWVYERIFFNYDRSTEIANITYYECLTCTGCCDYFITATPLNVTGMDIIVGNGRVAAIAQEVKKV